MRQGPHPKRLRGRGGRKNPNTNSNSRNQSFDSNGPEIRVRGNAQQVVEKYLSLARDSSLAGNRVEAENYFQHAEHYYRIMMAAGGEETRDTQPMTPSGTPAEPVRESAEQPEIAPQEANGNGGLNGANGAKSNGASSPADDDDGQNAPSPDNGGTAQA